MKNLSKFLLGFRNDIFKLLPMKEDERNGIDNHLEEYLDSLIINAKGSTIAFPELANQKQYLGVINYLCFLSKNNIDLKQWRKIVLNSTSDINELYENLNGKNNGKQS